MTLGGGGGRWEKLLSLARRGRGDTQVGDIRRGSEEEKNWQRSLTLSQKDV